MDLGSTLIGAIILAVCIMPFILMGLNRKKREKKLLQSIIHIANQQNCHISKHEICGDYIIGIDESSNVVFFLKLVKDKVNEQYINLSDIKNCKLKSTYKTDTNKNSNNRVIEKLELVFIPTDKNKNEIIWEFFNIENSVQLVGELQSVENWAKWILACIKTKK